MAKDQVRPGRTGVPEGMTTCLKPVEPDAHEVATTTNDNVLGSKSSTPTSFGI